MVYFAIILSVTLFLLLYRLINSYSVNPFNYQIVYKCFDISKKRQPVYEDYIDEWLINLSNHRKDISRLHRDTLIYWDMDCRQYIDNCILWKSHREMIYKKMRHEILQLDYKMFEFEFVRDQTRYRQQNYKKYSYTVKNTNNVLRFTIRELLNIDYELEEIGYSTTRSKWISKNQRKLMTKELRIKVKKRDNYTCKICGKHMPDEVGLHIDHMIPIKKGGKSIESNLQVLCDKCNLSKGAT